MTGTAADPQKVRIQHALTAEAGRRVGVEVGNLTRGASNDWYLAGQGLIGSNSRDAMYFLCGLAYALSLVDAAWHENGVRT